MGTVRFSNNRSAQLWGSDQNPNMWDNLQEGDRVMTCVDNGNVGSDPDHKVYKILFVDFDAGAWLDTVSEP